MLFSTWPLGAGHSYHPSPLAFSPPLSPPPSLCPAPPLSPTISVSPKVTEISMGEFLAHSTAVWLNPHPSLGRVRKDPEMTVFGERAR